MVVEVWCSKKKIRYDIFEAEVVVLILSWFLVGVVFFLLWGIYLIIIICGIGSGGMVSTSTLLCV